MWQELQSPAWCCGESHDWVQDWRSSRGRGGRARSPHHHPIVGSGWPGFKLCVPVDSVSSSGDAWVAFAWKLLWLILADRRLFFFLTCVLAYITLRLFCWLPHPCFSPLVIYRSSLFYSKQYRHLVANWQESRQIIKEASCPLPACPYLPSLVSCHAKIKQKSLLCNCNFFPICILCMKIFRKKFANNAPLNVSVPSIMPWLWFIFFFTCVLIWFEGRHVQVAA